MSPGVSHGNGVIAWLKKLKKAPTLMITFQRQNESVLMFVSVTAITDLSERFGH